MTTTRRAARLGVTAALTGGLIVGALATPGAARPGDPSPTDRGAAKEAARAERAIDSVRRDDPRVRQQDRRSWWAQRDARAAVVSGLEDYGHTAAVARVERGRYTWSGGAGVREQGSRTRAVGHEQLRAASNTKPMVATLVMQLVEDGTWTLDTTVGEVLPDLFPANRQGVTIRQLLQHTSGLNTGTNVAIALRAGGTSDMERYFEATRSDFTEQELVDAALLVPWMATPGTSYSYSNAGYVTLGMMLQEQTGQSVERLLERRVFRPAGMTRTEYSTDARTSGSFLVGSTDTTQGNFTEKGVSPTMFAASGAVTSTTRDLNRFSEALAKGELVAPELVKQMADTETFGYGLGTYRLPDPCAPEGSDQTLIGHDGASFGTLSMMFSSEDGSRQISLAVTRRSFYAGASREQATNMRDAGLALMATAC